MTDRFMDLPPSLQCNAWTGTTHAAAALEPERLHWSLRRPSALDDESLRQRAPPIEHDWNWRSPDVGWGLVLPDDDVIAPPNRRGTADDAPEPIRRLVAARADSPVLRWRHTPDGVGELLRYDASGRVWPLSLAGRRGIGAGQLPAFLLVFAPPDRIPWAFQYTANLGHFVGRLWLQGQALAHYVDALLSDWAGSMCDPITPLVWSVDHGQADITWLMDRAVSRKLADRWRSDADFAGFTGLFGSNATHDKLTSALARTRPGLVVTTSHGMTGPMNDRQAMATHLGVPVDALHEPMNVDALCQRWQPDGAIWYSHACCSAGSDTVSAYDGLFDPGSDVARVLAGVAAGCGACIAPLPQRLLGASRPLRAFIGHVEPTFDWSLRDPHTGQPLAHSLVDALYGKLFEGGERRPVGWAMGQVFRDVGMFMSRWTRACTAYNRNLQNSLDAALYYQIAALDRQHTVILGDPTVALPALRVQAAP
ncbi:hypothetical protein QTI66_38130 [Variovorax sp. J22R133]|uniref:hypothetical protein n=1 Tax=Variovorax brevis TaxID=3053503 RepID=UPI002578AC5D|nr:hypothetical protein [Variovorax sp. J22R133]MDM0117910.1 hypothetical protein [Variovorax sp. J22R133]